MFSKTSGSKKQAIRRCWRKQHTEAFRSLNSLTNGITGFKSGRIACIRHVVDMEET
jgi:hypothetical protein